MTRDRSYPRGWDIEHTFDEPLPQAQLDARSHGHSTKGAVFQAEILAIRLAMIRLNEILQTQDQYIKLFTDSQASLQALNSHEIKSLAVKDTILALNLVGQKVNRLEISWIKAHVGHQGNEMADKLAIETIKQ